MVGRAAYGDPALLLDVDGRLFGDDGPALSRHDAVEAYLPYVEIACQWRAAQRDDAAHARLFNGLPGARAWRRHLATRSIEAGAGIGTIREALSFVRARDFGCGLRLSTSHRSLDELSQVRIRADRKVLPW